MTANGDLGIKPLLLPPKLRTLDGSDGRRASYLELFFDLVFVVAIAQLAHELVVDHSLHGFAALAIQIPDAAHGDSMGFVLAYIVLRSLMVGLYLRSYRHVPEARVLIGRYAWEYSLAIAIWAASLAFESPTRYALWAVAIAWELSIPTLARRLFTAIPVHASHIPERFALFTIVVLGETIVVVALGTSGSDWDLAAAVVAALGFVAAAAIWWVYFGGGGKVTMSRSPAAIIVFTHAHIPLLAALTSVSAGIALAIEQASSAHLDAGTRWALAAGAALYLACVTAAQRATVQGLLEWVLPSRAVASLVLVALALVGGVLDPVVFMVVFATTLVLLVVFKLWTAQRLLGAGAA